jgi:16S rRNA (guanine527-N7)-methyltransferase
MPALTDDVIREALQMYGVSATVEICSAIRAYIPLLERWNRSISLTAVTNSLDILRFHFGESMFAAAAIPILNGRLADVGSGAGFPGIPLKLVIPSLSVVLIEPTAKKAAFLAEAIRVLGLENVEVYRGRFEDLAPSSGFDFVTARALGAHDELVAWSRGALKCRGNLVLWLGMDGAARVSMNNLWHWCKPLPIPGSHNRAILVGSPA